MFCRNKTLVAFANSIYKLKFNPNLCLQTLIQAYTIMINYLLVLYIILTISMSADKIVLIKKKQNPISCLNVPTCNNMNRINCTWIL